MADYQSSEEFQRHAAADAFTKAELKKAEVVPEKESFKKLLDKHIAKHESTVAVRALAKDNKRGAQYQLDLSADIVEELTKIKSELGIK